VPRHDHKAWRSQPWRANRSPYRAHHLRPQLSRLFKMLLQRRWHQHTFIAPLYVILVNYCKMTKLTFMVNTQMCCFHKQWRFVTLPIRNHSHISPKIQSVVRRAIFKTMLEGNLQRKDTQLNWLQGLKRSSV